MFCPKCGNADQIENTFCRQCGVFLPDFDKLKSKEITPEVHLQANIVLSLMTAIVSLTLVILHHVFFTGRENTPVLIYVTTGFLTAIFFWQGQTVWRNIQLKKQFKKTKSNQETTSSDKNPAINPAATKELLNEADLSNAVPASVVEYTTKNLKEKVIK